MVSGARLLLARQFMQSKSQSMLSAASTTVVAYSQKRSTDENNSLVTRRIHAADAVVAKRAASQGPDPRDRSCRRLQLRPLGPSVSRLCGAHCCSIDAGDSDFSAHEEMS